METEYKFKVVFLGDNYVGKSSIIDRFVLGTFKEEYNVTIGIDFLSKTLKIDDKSVRLQLWDFAWGKRLYPKIPSSTIKNTQAVIICYDITNEQSFQSLPRWINMIKESQEDILIYILGNKIDLKQEGQITTDLVKFLAFNPDLKYFEVSAKSNEKIESTFRIIAEDLLKYNQSKLQNRDIEIHLGKEEKLQLSNGNQKVNQCSC